MSPSYALPDYLDSLQEFDRAQRAEQANSCIPGSISAVSAGSKLLLAAIVSGLLVGANQWLESWNDGNLLTDWMVLFEPKTSAELVPLCAEILAVGVPEPSILVIANLAEAVDVPPTAKSVVVLPT